jgi:hypothetical protein
MNDDKIITITNAFSYEIKERHSGLKDIIVSGMDESKDNQNFMEASDGYHTFTELYEHRIELFITLCRLLASKYKLQIDGQGVWRSKLHSDGFGIPGWFVLGILTVPGQQITYHLPIAKWEETEFAYTLENAPKYDGHTSDDVLKRLKTL